MKYKFSIILVTVFTSIARISFANSIPTSPQPNNMAQQPRISKPSSPNTNPQNPRNMAQPTLNRTDDSPNNNAVNPQSNNNHPNNNINNGPVQNSNEVLLNFENADIQSVIKAIGVLSGKNFVIDPRVHGKVNIISTKPISKTDSYKVLEAALRMQGFSAVESDGVIKVLPETDAKTYGMRTFGDSKVRQLGDQVITKIYVLDHGSANQLAIALRQIVSPNSSISIYQNSNAIVVTDYASNIKRMDKILADLNTGGIKASPSIIHLQYAVASDIAQVLHAYLQGGNAGGNGSPGGGYNTMMSDGPNVSITVDPITNSLIVYSTVKSKLEEIRKLALSLDKNIGKDNNDLHVVYLRNADASHIAEVLRAVVDNQENPDMKASTSLAKFANEPSSTFGNNSGSGGSSGGFGGSSSQSSSSSSSSGSYSAYRPGGNSNGQQNNPNAPQITIQAEPTSNALIIKAPEPVYKNLRMIIDMLDVRRAEIMIEALIVDLQNNTKGAFGIQWLIGAGNNTIGGLGVGNYGGNSPNSAGSDSLSSLGSSIYSAVTATNSSSNTSVTSTPAGAGLQIPGQLYVGLVTGTTTIGGQTVPNLGALANMIEANEVGNVIARPTLITLDNEEARFVVGQNIPIPNGSFTNTANSSPTNATTTFSRTDIGTILQIKPLITQSGAIQLDLYQEDSKLAPGSATSTSSDGPTIDKRTMRTSLLVDDGQIIAIGGMSKDDVEIQQNGIPLLMDIPYLGWLFSWQSRVHLKTDLVLFLRPVIIRSRDGYEALTNQRYSYVVNQQEQIKAKGNLMLPRIDPVTLDNQRQFVTPNTVATGVDTQPSTSLGNANLGQTIDLRGNHVNPKDN